MTDHPEFLPPPAASSSEAVETAAPEKVFHSEDLLDADGLAIVMHRGQTYRLRQTRLGKLILTK